MNIKERNRRRELQRALKVEIKIYEYGWVQFREPTKQRLESFKFTQKILRTYRHDYRQFSFVRAEVNGYPNILVVKFAENQIDRISCQLLKNWDPRYSFIWQDEA